MRDGDVAGRDACGKARRLQRDIETRRDEALALLKAFIGFARWRALGAAGLVGLGAVLEGAGLLMLAPVIAVLTEARGSAGAAGAIGRRLLDLVGAFGRDQRLLILLGAFVALMAARAVALWWRDGVVGRLQLEFVEWVRMGLVSRIGTAGWRRASRLSHARLVQALTLELNQVSTAANAAVQSAVAVAMIVGNCALALLLAPSATGAAIAFALVGIAASRLCLDGAKRLGRTVSDAHFRMTQSTLSLLNGLKLAAAQGQEEACVRDYAAQAQSVVGHRLALLGLQSRLRNLTGAAAAVAAAALLFFGVSVFHLPAAVLLPLLFVMARMIGPALTLQQGLQQIMNSLPAFGAVRAAEAELGAMAGVGPRIEPRATPAAGDAAPRPMRFRRVSFRHGADAAAPAPIQDFDLEIPPGAFVGVVGPSGAGKTTFLDLAAGLLEPQSGQILVGGRPLEGRELARHRLGLAYVAQDPFLVDGSVRRNLAWPEAGCAEAEMLDALDLVDAGGLVRRLEHGLDTRIGERGVLISAGERQRLALARALLRRPTLLVLDEATNAIDVESERRILERLSSLRPRATMLMAAHRAESLAFCDHILQFPGGVLERSLPAAARLGGRA